MERETDTGDELRTVDGRMPGRRGQETRRRLLEVTAEMLRTGSYRDLAVVDIAREVGVSPATFYQYFPDVETAIFFIADHIADEGRDRLTGLVEDIDLQTTEGAEALAEGFLDLWRQYDAIFRVLDLGAAERDARFQSRRTQLLSGPTTALQEAITAQQAAGALAHSIDPAAVAATPTAQRGHGPRVAVQQGDLQAHLEHAVSDVVGLDLGER